MAAPTTERAIYKSAIKKSEIRAIIETDYPVVASAFSDTFTTDGSTFETMGTYSTRWYVFKPEGARINVLGNLVVGVDTAVSPYGILRPPCIWTKEGIVFPVDKSKAWTLEWSMRFNFAGSPSILTTYLPSAFKICGIDNAIYDDDSFTYGSVCQINGDQFLGTDVMMPEGTILSHIDLADTGFHTYRLEWGRITGPAVMYYDLYVDNVWAGELAGAQGGATIRGADFISVGGPGWGTLSSNIPAIWSEIEVEYVTITYLEATESVTNPSWYSAVTNPFTTYDSNDTNHFSYLPQSSLIAGHVSVDKNNQIDVCEITLEAQDPSSTNRNIFRDFHFQNRRILVESRQSNGISWTSWKRIFVGVVDEASYEITDQGGINLSLQCRDLNRRKLQRTTLTRAYADFTDSIVGIPNSLVVSSIMADIAEQAKLTTEATYDSDPGAEIAIYGNVLKPKVINIINQDGLSALTDLAEDVVYEMFVDHKNHLGKIYVRPYSYPVHDTDYDFSVYDEVILVNYTPTTVSHVGQIEMTFESANQSPFFAQYPANRWPGDSSVQQRPSRLVQNLASVTTVYPFHLSAWRRENRDNGSIEITTVGQDWLEMNLIVSMLDDIFLNIPVTIYGPFFIVDGWEYTWDEQNFLAKIRLVYWRPHDFARQFL